MGTEGATMPMEGLADDLVAPVADELADGLAETRSALNGTGGDRFNA